MEKLFTYGERLAWAIAKRKTSAAELSRKSGINKASISQYINGTTGAPRNVTSAKLASSLDVNQFWLDTGQGDWDALTVVDNKNHNVDNPWLSSSSNSVIDLIENLKDMERTDRLAPELVSLLNATIETFKQIENPRPKKSQTDLDHLLNIAKEANYE